MIIRTARLEDVAPVTGLLSELSCTADEPEIRDRLTRLLDLPTERVFVATVADEVVGMIGAHFAPLLHRDSLVRITSFIVTESYRERGIGKRLLREVEAWALSNGCTQIEVTSGDHHGTAHGFYEHHGYRLDDRRFVKESFDET